MYGKSYRNSKWIIYYISYMITDVIVVYNEDSQIKKLGGTFTLKVSPFFRFINEDTHKGKKEAWALKSHWGAKMTPFAICMEGEKVVKAFYSETGEDVIKSLIDYLNEQDIHS